MLWTKRLKCGIVYSGLKNSELFVVFLRLCPYRKLRLPKGDFMKKSIILFCSLICLSLAFSACGNSSGIPAATSSPAEPGYFYTSNGVEIVPGADFAPILEKLGAAKNTFEAPSCAFEGIDKIFYYPGFEVHTFPKNEKDYVLSVSLTDDSVSTGEGVYIGMEKDRALGAISATPSEDNNQLTFTKGSTSLIILVESGAIVSITYFCTDTN